MFDDRTYVRVSGHSNVRSAGEHLFGMRRARRNPRPRGTGVRRPTGYATARSATTTTARMTAGIIDGPVTRCTKRRHPPMRSTGQDRHRRQIERNRATRSGASSAHPHAHPSPMSPGPLKFRAGQTIGPRVRHNKREHRRDGQPGVDFAGGHFAPPIRTRATDPSASRADP